MQRDNWASSTKGQSPPKGEPKRGMMPTNKFEVVYTSVLSHSKVTLFSDTPFRIPLWGTVEKRGRFRSKPKRYRTDRHRNDYVTRNSVQHRLLGPEDRSNIETEIPNHFEVEPIEPRPTLKTLGQLVVYTQIKRRGRLKGVLASPRCCWSPIGDLLATNSQKVSHQSVTTNNIPFLTSPFCVGLIYVVAFLGNSVF